MTYCQRTSRLILCVNHKDTALQSSDDRTVSILPALVSFGLLNHKDDVASKASNSRLVSFERFLDQGFKKLSLKTSRHSLCNCGAPELSATCQAYTMCQGS